MSDHFPDLLRRRSTMPNRHDDLVAPMRETAVWRRIVLSEDTGPSDSINPAAILRAFDQVRRDLATKVSGTQGCFPGYDRLDLGVPDGRVTSVTVLAVASAVGPRSHGVHYTALADSAREAAWRVVGTAQGTTLTPHTRRTSAEQ